MATRKLTEEQRKRYKDAYYETCPICGGRMFGDGYKEPIACEMVDTQGLEPDSGPWFCDAND